MRLLEQVQAEYLKRCSSFSTLASGTGYWEQYVHRAWDSLNIAVRLVGGGQIQRPALGVLAAGTPNAHTRNVAGTREHIVVFNSGLFTFVHLVLKVFIVLRGDAAGETNEQSRARLGTKLRSLGTSDPAFVRFRELVRACLFDGHPIAAPSHTVTREEAAEAEVLAQAIELFVVSHEFGHICLFEASTSDPHVEELAADRFGFMLYAVFSAAAFRDAQVAAFRSLWPPVLYLAATSVILRAEHVLSFGDDKRAFGSTSHPDPGARKESLYVEYRRMFGDLQVVEAIDAAEFAWDAMERLWALLRPELLDLHRDGARPNQFWLTLDTTILEIERQIGLVRRPGHSDIAEAAYFRWSKRGGGHGRDLEDWFEAERSLALR